MNKAIILIGFFAIAVYGMARIEPSDPDPTAGPRGACAHFIEQLAHDPRSIEWIGRPDWPTNLDRPDGIITVRAEYRARNQIGGMVRQVSFCDISHGDGEYRLVDLR